jgi:hypothetical protein
MAKKRRPHVITGGMARVLGHYYTEDGRMMLRVEPIDPPDEPEASRQTDTLKRAMIVAIVRRDFRGRQPIIAEVHRHIQDNKAAVWKAECARQRPPVIGLGPPGRDTIASTLEDAGLIKRKFRAKSLTK